MTQVESRRRLGHKFYTNLVLNEILEKAIVRVYHNERVDNVA